MATTTTQPALSSWGTPEGWIAILALALGTFLIRYAFIGLFAGKALPPRIALALQLAVPAIFAALVIPLVILHPPSNSIDLAQRWPHVIAALIVGLAAWRGGGLFTSLVLGMGSLHGLLWLIG